ncbi:hypothetical protein K491DRAFT_604523 [Lophiostoma macrostomum CBS 122681]|uniref:Zn(2)-C6 fungal-type domain-containing protein n=1 Tax=Lophiostoma macrostomum CBS 122681 TaxID=1314788 RepID=A0A6A6SY39_9PLEO|nr:hypothetical protein K491DRAFT_604523 [Lophiostoma macrostomum CBS 122681]
MHSREINTCTRCRESKRKCDKSKPACSRCVRAGVSCSLEASSLDSSNSTDGEGVDSVPFIFSTAPHSAETSSLDSYSPLPAYETAPSGTFGLHLRPDSGLITRKRNRARLSCTRCHRLKVKCDRREPYCNRCALSGFAKTCIYTHRAHKITETPEPEKPQVPEGEIPEEFVTGWFMRQRVSRHWGALLNKVESLTRINCPELAHAYRESLKGDYSSDLALPPNYGIGSPESVKYASLSVIWDLLRESRSSCQTYLDHYILFYQPVYPVLSTDTFQKQVDDYWSQPEKMNISWLALYLSVLGLGAFARHRDMDIASPFLLASEACLAKTPYQLHPTLTNIQTLTLMVVAKHVANATCWAFDSSWSLMGIVVRLAVMACLHRSGEPAYYGEEFQVELEARRRIWTTIVYLDMQLSLITGQPSLLPADTLLLSGDNVGFHETIRSPEDAWRSLLPESFPIIYHFLNRINLGPEDITYDEVIQYDFEIRSIMARIGTMKECNPTRFSLEIFFRRLLLCLHRFHALQEDAALMYPISYWSSLECSLAILAHQREVAFKKQQMETVEVMGRPYLLDFLAAAVTASIHLLRTDAPLAPANDGTIPPRQTIMTSLISCVEIFLKDAMESLCYRTGCGLLVRILKMVPEASEEVFNMEQLYAAVAVLE